MKDKNENSKDTDWQTPMKIKGAKKGAYNNSMNASSGSQNISGSGDPGGDAGNSEDAKKLTYQTDKSG